MTFFGLLLTIALIAFCVWLFGQCGFDGAFYKIVRIVGIILAVILAAQFFGFAIPIAIPHF